MSIPSLCPKMESGSCIGDECPLYVMDWRSKEEYCNVGYYQKHERTAIGEQVVDNYAAQIKSPLEQTSDKTRLDIDSMLNEFQESEEPAPVVVDENSKTKNKMQGAPQLMNMGDISEDYEAQFWG